MKNVHSKTIKDVLEIFEPYLTEEDILEAIEECKKFREKKTVILHINKRRDISQQLILIKIR